jgi:hypothetical protein
MKKLAAAATLAILVGMSPALEAREDRQYANVCFTVWQMKNGASEAIRRIDTPIPEVLRESWICDIFSLDITEGKPVTKVMEKERFRFILTAGSNTGLTIQVYEKGNALFRFDHNRPSAVDYIFYGSDRFTYLMEVSYTTGNHRIGLVSPGILKIGSPKTEKRKSVG